MASAELPRVPIWRGTALVRIPVLDVPGRIGGEQRCGERRERAEVLSSSLGRGWGWGVRVRVRARVKVRVRVRVRVKVRIRV